MLTPGLAWKELVPWKPDKPEGRKRLLRWARPEIALRKRDDGEPIDVIGDRVRVSALVLERWAWFVAVEPAGAVVAGSSSVTSPIAPSKGPSGRGASRALLIAP